MLLDAGDFVMDADAFRAYVTKVPGAAELTPGDIVVMDKACRTPTRSDLSGVRHGDI